MTGGRAASGSTASFFGSCFQRNRLQRKKPAPLNSPGPLRGPGSRPAALGKLACGPGESGMPTHSQHSAKVAEIVATAARITRAIDPGARGSAAGILVRASAPGLQPANIPWRLLAFRQSSRSAGSASLFRAFRQHRTPGQEDKVRKNIMDNKRLIRLLTKKLSPYCSMTSWLLERQISSAVEETMEKISELDDLREQLHTRIVRFSYRKMDGSLREAIGTLKPSVLDKLSANTKPRRHTSGRSDCIVYYDLDREDWRCFCPENFVSMS